MRKRGNIIFGFIVLILVMGLGFAYLNSDLNINGITNISNASWNVYWDNVNVTSGSVTDVTTAAHILTGETEVEFNVNFTKPGDFYEFTVDAVNDGSIDAMVDNLTKGVYASNGTTPKTLPDYLTYSVTYSDGVEIESNHLLSAGHTETYKVRVEYKTDIEANQLPSTADNYMFKIAVNYKQADSNAAVRARYVYTANFFDFDYETLNDGTNTSVIWLGQPLFNGITTYQTPELAMAAVKQGSGGITEKPFFLKHKIENNIVTESYVGFVITPEMAGANPGMIPGTYYLRGGVDETSAAEKTIYETNTEIIKQAFGYLTNSSRCPTNTNYQLTCRIGSLEVNEILNGNIYADNRVGTSCSINPGVRSNCLNY